MKTTVKVIRNLQEFELIQRSSDKMFDATTLLKQWNIKNKSKKQLDHFFENIGTNDFIDVLISEENLNTRNSVYLKTRGKNGGTWMHPYLFIKFAMWLNPKFEYHVIKFIYDQLIEHRIMSGDYYLELCSRLSRFSNVDYQEVGKILNFVVFNKHSKGLRNYATPDQQNDLQQLTRDIVNYIDMGFINSFKQFKDTARKEWYKRHNNCPKILM